MSIESLTPHTLLHISLYFVILIACLSFARVASRRGKRDTEANSKIEIYDPNGKHATNPKS